MSDRMTPLPFDKLMLWVLKERDRNQSIFGISEDKFFAKTNSYHHTLFGDKLESPLGPAAGPHTQLAQNIVVAYITGCRFFELKTVQVIDGEDLPVSKPCILAQDEGYNVEWSTELTVPDALDEYIKAWFALNILSEELSLGDNKGFIFNMSVGYDLEGIKSPKINSFIDNLKDASQSTMWKECMSFLLNHLELFKCIDKEYVEGISPLICKSITLSTLHGCPPAEIERIATYLMVEKHLHTYIKCNPTLLGYEFARSTLVGMGYDYMEFDDYHFKNDLPFEEAVPLIRRLKLLAKDLGLTFGVKLTNTFPVKILKEELPGDEMYMSGKPLYPLTINLAYRLAKEFQGDIRISYSGGADYFNIDRIYQIGIWPITIATTILKPGGYLRMKQLADLLETKDQSYALDRVDVEQLRLLAEEAIIDTKHCKSKQESKNTYIDRKIPLTNCYIAPCKYGCPIGQDIPEYVRLVGEERYLEALRVIVAKNPLPFITGTLCNHRCMTRCTRQYYDESIRIRETKLLAARHAFQELMSKLDTPAITSEVKIAIIGGGPAGLSGAYFLGKQGFDVTVFDKKEEIGGVITHIAPNFRISQDIIQNDMELIRKMGVKFRLGVNENFSIESLKKEGFKYVFIAIGAWKPGLLKLETCDKEIMNVLDFLETYNKFPDKLKLGKYIAVVGAGNSAMDAARAATRVAGVEKVYLVYRRTIKYIPANQEELELAFKDGVEIMELVTPVSYEKGVLRCQRMELGEPDASGRRSPVAIHGEYMELIVDSVIAAIGEQVDSELLLKNNLEFDVKGRIRVNPDTYETSVENVFIGGDALRGPATIVEGIADGTTFARIILARENGLDLKLETSTNFDLEHQIREIKGKKGMLQSISNINQEKNRCLECNVVCNLCVEVCPNRANVVINVPSDNLRGKNQIVHMDGMCNECGNCMTFCPYDSAPYKDKFTLYWTMEEFMNSKNSGFLLLDKASHLFRVRLDQKLEVVAFDCRGSYKGDFPKELAAIIWAVYNDYFYLFK